MDYFLNEYFQTKLKFCSEINNSSNSKTPSIRIQYAITLQKQMFAVSDWLSSCHNIVSWRRLIYLSCLFHSRYFFLNNSQNNRFIKLYIISIWTTQSFGRGSKGLWGRGGCGSRGMWGVGGEGVEGGLKRPYNILAAKLCSSDSRYYSSIDRRMGLALL